MRARAIGLLVALLAPGVAACGGGAEVSIDARPPPDAGRRADARAGAPDAGAADADTAGATDAAAAPDGTVGATDAAPPADAAPPVPPPADLVEITAAAGRVRAGALVFDVQLGHAVGPRAATGGGLTLEGRAVVRP